MIIKTDELSAIEKKDVFSLRIMCEIESFPDTTVLYKSDLGGYIADTKGGCIISGEFNGAELSSFINFLSPKTIFSNLQNAEEIKGYKNRKTVTVFEKCDTKETKFSGDELKSDEIYDILKKAKGFSLPPFEQFAVNFCRQKNKNNLFYTAFRERAVAIASVSGEWAYISAVASLKAGCGSAVLGGLLSKLKGKKVFAVCEEKIKPFYIKNGFTECDKAIILEQ
ncbi:MAG: hypothetical protein IKF53_03190 [Clostridia bacterium]|nr:hypothetical protein [Clostridia bacterium]